MKQALAITLIAGVLLLPPQTSPAYGGSSARAISRESAARLLERRFSASGASYILMDAHSGSILASNWPELDRPVPLGSLLKPFTAIAYGETHSYEYPQYECRGAAGGCWRPRGHGRIGITQAIAHSCNAYFRELASGLRAQDVSATLARFGLSPLDPRAPPSALYGMGDAWRATPRQLLRAYLEIAQRHEQPGARQVVQGMRLASQSGTGEAVGRALHADALVKTGTAACVHGGATGDGYAVVLAPADSPQLALLVSLHEAPGSHAAAAAGKMLRALTHGSDERN